MSDVSQGNDNWFSCPCGGKAYWDPEIAIGNYIIGGWRCPDCGEEMYEPNGANLLLAHNKLRKKGYELKLNRVRSNLILRIPVDVSFVLGLDAGDTVELGLNERDEIVVKTGKRPLAMLRRKKQ